jgi:hypothetical protein
MSDHVSIEDLRVIRILFFRRLADTNNDLVGLLTDIGVQIEERKHNALLGLYDEIENRIQSMRTILIVFRECLEG